jgi:hypothetical protein
MMLVLCLPVLFSCSTSTQLVSVWEDENYREEPFRQLLVIGLAKTESVRRAFEDHFSSQLGKRGTEAVSSAKILPMGQLIDKETIKKALEGSNLDGVIISRVVSIDDQKEIVQGQAQIVKQTYYDHFNQHYVTVYQQEQTPATVNEKKVISIETSLFSVKSEKLVYSAATETFDPVDAEDVIKSLSKLIIKDLHEAGFID